MSQAIVCEARTILQAASTVLGIPRRSVSSSIGRMSIDVYDSQKACADYELKQEILMQDILKAYDKGDEKQFMVNVKVRNDLSSELLEIINQTIEYYES